MIVNGTMLRAGVEEVVPASRLVRSDKTNVATNTVIYGLFCDFTQHRMVVPYRRLGTTYRSHLQGSVDFLTVEYGTDRMSRNVGREFTIRRCVISQRSANLMYIAAKAWNHGQKLINCTVSWHDDGSNFSRNMQSSYSSSFRNKRNFLR